MNNRIGIKSVHLKHQILLAKIVGYSRPNGLSSPQTDFPSCRNIEYTHSMLIQSRWVSRHPIVPHPISSEFP